MPGRARNDDARITQLFSYSVIQLLTFALYPAQMHGTNTKV